MVVWWHMTIYAPSRDKTNKSSMKTRSPSKVTRNDRSLRPTKRQRRYWLELKTIVKLNRLQNMTGLSHAKIIDRAVRNAEAYDVVLKGE